MIIINLFKQRVDPFKINLCNMTFQIKKSENLIQKSIFFIFTKKFDIKFSKD